MIPLTAAFIQETTVFRDFGPLAGSTMRLAYTVAPKIGSTLSRQTFDGDVRYYQRLASNGVLALRFHGFQSIGGSPDFLYFGGNSEMRGYDYLQFVGQKAFYANAELRFPIIEAALTPIGVIGGIRGVFFANMGGGSFANQDFTFATTKPTVVTSPLGVTQVIDGFRLVDGGASYGLGLETFALGFPIHFDWAWRTLLDRDWEDAVFGEIGGSLVFRKPRFVVWIGYDF